MSDYRAIPDAIIVPFLLEGEAEVLRVYDDKRPRKILKPGDEVLGVLTAGVGHTGSDLTIGMRVTKAMSRAWLKSDLINKAAKPLMRKIGVVVHELTDNQYAALLSFVFNLGTGPKQGHPKEWGIWRKLRARQFDLIHAEFAKFVYWDGKKSDGLVKRRAAEQVLWATKEPGSAPTLPPSSVTRREETPPLAADPTPARKDPALLAAGGTGVVTLISTTAQQAPETIKQVTEVVRPFSGDSDIALNLIGTLSTIAMVLAVLTFVIAYIQKRRRQT